MSRSSPDDIWQLWNFKQMQKLSWHNLSLKTVVVHNSVTSVMMKTNLQKGGLVHRVPYAKSREKLQEFFQSVYVLFCNINTITYFNLFVCPLKQRDMSVMTRVSNFILWFYLNFLLLLFISTLCVVHNLIFQRKLSRRRLLITFVYFVSHASAQVSRRPITFTQRFRTTRHLFSIRLLWKPKILNVEDKRTKFERSKGDLGQFSESCKWSLTRAQLSKHMDLRCF